MNDNYVLAHNGKSYQVNDPYSLIEKDTLLESLTQMEKKLVQNQEIAELEIWKVANFLILGTDGGILFCRVKQIQSPYQEFVFMIEDKYDEQNQYGLARWMYKILKMNK